MRDVGQNFISCIDLTAACKLLSGLCGMILFSFPPCFNREERMHGFPEHLQVKLHGYLNMKFRSGSEAAPLVC